MALNKVWLCQGTTGECTGACVGENRPPDVLANCPDTEAGGAAMRAVLSQESESAMAAHVRDAQVSPTFAQTWLVTPVALGSNYSVTLVT